LGVSNHRIAVVTMHDPAIFIHEPQGTIALKADIAAASPYCTRAPSGSHARIVHKITVTSKYGPAQR
jgi:hypothetical protein